MPFLDDAQRTAVRQLSSGKILCGGVGSGKSRTSLAYYFTRECGGEFEPEFKPMINPMSLVIITTAKKRDSKEWELELAHFLLNRERANKMYGIDIIIDSWNNIKKYEDMHDAFFIFDEQRVVGSGAWVNSFYKITASGRYINRSNGNKWILLTATPGDTWTDYIPVFVANKFYRNKSEFSRRHIIYSRYTRFPSIDKYIEEPYLQHLRDYILVDIRMTKTTVRHTEFIKVEYDKEKVKEVMKSRMNPYTDEPIADAAQLCYVMRRIVNETDSRADAIRSLMLLHSRLIIFYNFDYELELLRDIMENSNMTYAEWNGHKHQDIPDTPQWVYLVQYTAGAEGWNCIETDTIIFFSLNYSYKTTEQAMGRIDRRNTPYTDLYYYFLKSGAWIDNAINKALESKKNFNIRKHEQALGYSRPRT